MNEYPWLGRAFVEEHGVQRIPLHRQRCEVQLADSRWAPAVYCRDGFSDGGDAHTFWDPNGWVMYEDSEVKKFRQLPPVPGPPGPSAETLASLPQLHRQLAKLPMKEVVPNAGIVPGLIQRPQRTDVAAGAAGPSDPGAGPRSTLVEVTVALVPVPDAARRLEAGERFCSICGVSVGRFVGVRFARSAVCGVGRGCYRCQKHTQESI